MSDSPIAFVKPGRPVSANKTKGHIGDRIKGEYQRLYRAAGGALSEQFRYGIVYYFVRDYRPAVHADADNTSKHVWDSLQDVAYRDDSVIRLRMAGVIEAGEARDGSPCLDAKSTSFMWRLAR